MPGLEPLISVKAAVIAQGPTGLDGLVVRAANLSPIQYASNFGKKQERERERGGDDCLYVKLVTVSFHTVESYSHS